MPMHKSVKPPIKIIHAEVILCPPPSKKREIPGFLKDLVLLLNQSHPHWRDLLLVTCVGPTSLRDKPGRCAGATQPSAGLCFVSKLASAYFLAFETKQSPGITMSLPFQKSTKQKQNPGEGFLGSTRADVRDTKREIQTFTAGPLSN